MNTIFRNFFDDSPQVKVIDFFVDNSILNHGWSIVEIRDQTNTGYSTLKLLLPRLVKQRILKVEKQLGKIKFYQLNKNNLSVQRLLAFDWRLRAHSSTHLHNCYYWQLGLHASDRCSNWNTDCFCILSGDLAADQEDQVSTDLSTELRSIIAQQTLFSIALLHTDNFRASRAATPAGRRLYNKELRQAYKKARQYRITLSPLPGRL